MVDKDKYKKVSILGVDERDDSKAHNEKVAAKLKIEAKFIAAKIADTPNQKVDIAIALHACDTATDDAINFALNKKSQYIILVPCCQAEVASIIKKTKSQNILGEIWRHPIHTREFGSHITNVLRGLLLEANGYDVTITELVGWEHSIKNELIIARYNSHKDHKLISNANNKLEELLATLGLKEGLKNRYNAFLRQDKF